MNTIVIVGGVATGMGCVARLRRLDEQTHVIVLEKGTDISIASRGLPYSVDEEIVEEVALRVRTPKSIYDSLSLDIRVNTGVLAVDSADRSLRTRSSQGREELTYDTLVLTPGTRSVDLPIPGIDLPFIKTLCTIPDAVGVKEIAEPGRRAVVVGAGFTGLKAAESLRLTGMKVALVEESGRALPPVEEELSSLVLDELEYVGITVIESARVGGIEGKGGCGQVVVKGIDALEAGLVLVVVGAHARIELTLNAGIRVENGTIDVDSRGRTSDEYIWAAGDAALSTITTVGTHHPVVLAGPASRAERRITNDIVSVFNGQAPATKEIVKPLGTAIVRAGDLQVAMTGSNSRELARAGIPFGAIHTHHVQHVDYFPGTSTISLMVLLDEDGGILGAQDVGREGVDRRIDVLATTICAGFKAEELIGLDLAYAPPLGAPKDSVNMIGMIAENLFDGMLELWYANQLDEIRKTHLILDVHQPDEIAEGLRIPGLPRITHTELRRRMDKVREAAGERPIAIHCHSGVRFYLAHRMLAGTGFKSASLDGGMLTLEAWAKRHPGLIER